MNKFILFVLSVCLFIGGAYILSLKIPFWSMFLGIASIQVGIVFIIFTFEVYFKSGNKPLTDQYSAVPCLICQQIGFIPKYKRTNICDDCQIKIAKSFKVLGVFLITSFSLTTLLYVSGQNQDFRRKASELQYSCSKENWTPEDCKCSRDTDIKCEEGWIAKNCSDKKNYCCTIEIVNNKINWVCDLQKK